MSGGLEFESSYDPVFRMTLRKPERQWKVGPTVVNDSNAPGPGEPGSPDQRSGCGWKQSWGTGRGRANPDTKIQLGEGQSEGRKYPITSL